MTALPELMTHLPEPFTITRRIERGCHVLTLYGELDLDTAPELEDTLNACANGSGSPIIADITELTFISSAGIHVLIRDDSPNSVHALVRSPHSNIARVLELVDAKRRLPLFDTLDAALAGFGELADADHPMTAGSEARQAHSRE